MDRAANSSKQHCQCRLIIHSCCRLDWRLPPPPVLPKEQERATTIAKPLPHCYCAAIYFWHPSNVPKQNWTLGGRLERRDHLFTDMAQIAKISVSLVAICLLGYFFKEIASSVNKLKDAKVGTSTTRHYKRVRFFPSISICYRWKPNINNFSNPEHALNASR